MKVFFLQGPGGTGKNLVENYLLAKVSAGDKKSSFMASSEIAAVLLQGIEPLTAISRSLSTFLRVPV